MPCKNNLTPIKISDIVRTIFTVNCSSLIQRPLKSALYLDHALLRPLTGNVNTHVNLFYSLCKFSRRHIDYMILIFPENRIWHFMQIVSWGDNLHELSKPTFWQKIKIFQNDVCWDIYSRVLSVKISALTYRKYLHSSFFIRTELSAVQHIWFIIRNIDFTSENLTVNCT